MRSLSEHFYRQFQAGTGLFEADGEEPPSPDDAPRKSLVFAFGRFNPPTRGHEVLITAMQKKAEVIGADVVLFVSGTTDRTRNPLTYDEKVKIIRQTFPDLTIGPKTVKSPVDALTWGQEQGYVLMVMMIGKDDNSGIQHAEYKRMIEGWSRKSDPEHLVDVTVEEIPRQGDMDPSKVSGTVAREMARRGDYDGLRDILMTGTDEKTLKDMAVVMQSRLGALTESLMMDIVDTTDITPEPDEDEDDETKLLVARENPAEGTLEADPQPKTPDSVMGALDAIFEEDDAASDMTPEVDETGAIEEPDEEDDGLIVDPDDPLDQTDAILVQHPSHQLKHRLVTRFRDYIQAKKDADHFSS